MHEAHLDFETRSTTDLKPSGVYRYAEDENTGVWGFCWRIGIDGPVHRWQPGYPDPHELLEHIALGYIVVAHNAAFERVIWNWVLRARYCPHWPPLLLEQQNCTQARSAAIAHPQMLDKVCQVLDTQNKKDKEGHALMLKMSKPRKIHADGRIEWWDQPENVERLMGAYCPYDVLTESDVDTKLPPLTPMEDKVWKFDQMINDRGINIDKHAAIQAANLVEYAKKQADKIMRELTGRAVPRCTNDNKLITWLQSRGLNFDTVKKGVLDDIIFMASMKKDQVVQEVIELRRASKKTSTAKYNAMLKCVCSDDRIRGLLNYHGASTGRWAGRLVQPQNFPRVDYDKEGHIFEWMQELFHQNLSPKELYDTIACVHGEDKVLVLMSRALRSMICAPKGKVLIGGDFSNIEGRVNADFAQEKWKLDAFRAYDEGHGIDLYKLGYANAFNVHPDSVNDFQRQIGKVQELALGFQGSIGAYLSMGDNYGVTPYSLSGPVYEATPAEVWDKTAMQYANAFNKFNLQEKEWTATKILVDGWRASNPCIVQSWWDYQDAALEAVTNPGYAVYCGNGKVQYFSDGRCLWCILPSGRMLCYSAPEVKREEVAYTDKRTGEHKTRWKNTVMFWGMDSVTKQWRKQSLYGGLQCENIVQATARDLMVDRMLAVEAAGYPIILTVHDEIVSEVPVGVDHLNDENFKNIMSVLPAWAEGLPLSVKAWEHERYVK